MTTKETPKFGWRDKIGYAMGDFGCNMSFALISSYMADFSTISDMLFSIVIM